VQAHVDAIIHAWSLAKQHRSDECVEHFKTGIPTAAFGAATVGS
jgi:hypothetical protein